MPTTPDTRRWRTPSISRRSRRPVPVRVDDGSTDPSAGPRFRTDDDARLPVVVVLDNVRSLYNTGAFFRTADACRIERLVLCGITPRPDQGRKQQRAIAKTALGAELTVPWEYRPDTAAALAALAANGYRIVAVETSPDAIDLYTWTPAWPICLVFGHEKDGVTE